MYKIISFPKSLGYSICAKKLAENQAVMPSVRHCASVGCLLVAQDEFEKLTKLIGKEGYTVSNEVQVRLHSQDEIPWGVEHVGAPALWNVTQGKGIKVAVIDTGISHSHPDLKGQVKGKISVVRGAGQSKTIGGHGTHVAGTIAAIANNGGIVGIAPQVDLYDVQAFGVDGTANISDIITGINWAIEQKVDIINMSFGTGEDHPAFHQALRVAARNGIVLVASAGNNGGGLEFPAAYREVVAVGAINQQAKLAEFSARGRGLNTVAPGVAIKSTWINKEYRTLDGTSMAAAHISGVYALRLARQRSRGKNRVNKRVNNRTNEREEAHGKKRERNDVKSHENISANKNTHNRQNKFSLFSLFKKR